MNAYAQKMIEMMNRTGQPMTTTTTGQTTTKAPNEGLDLSGIMMMLMLNSMFKNQTPGISDPSNILNPIPYTGPAGGYTPLAGSAPTSTVVNTPMPSANPIAQILMNLLLNKQT